MYRFRSIDSLIGKHKELENQEIYFAAPHELNDPMEGFQDIFWKGDSIVWNNFIKNYVRSLEHAFGLVFLLQNDRKIDAKDILVLSQPHRLETLDNQKLIQKIIGKVFENEFIKNLPDELSKRQHEIRRDELIAYIETIHPFVLEAISDIYLERKFILRPFLNRNLKEFSELIKKSGNLVELTNKMEVENNKIGKFYTAINQYSQQIRLMTRYNQDINVSTSNNLFLISEFPMMYLLQLEASIHPEWYSASFLSEHTNSAIWGHYGDGHKGVCLKYKVTENESGLSMNLNTEYGYSSGPIVGMIPHTFKKIDYSSKHVEIDFFRSIARLNRMTLKMLWYSDENGNLSDCGDHLKGKESEEEWRNKYWDNYDNRLRVKLKEWAYENEYRLTLSGDFIDYRERKARKLKYDFNDLESIIFGIKTTDDDKLKILRIIEQKCKENNRKEFDFQQAYYSKDDGKIKTYKLDLLKFD